MLAHELNRHDQSHTEMQHLHPQLFAPRRQNWWQSETPWRCKLFVPLVERLPATRWTRYRLARLVFRPSVPLKIRLAPLRRTRFEPDRAHLGASAPSENLPRVSKSEIRSPAGDEQSLSALCRYHCV
jgi:hypothetical protein